MTTFLVTGGAGFIGANLVRHLLDAADDHLVVVLDLLTYAGSLANLDDLRALPRLHFVQGDIADRELVASTLRTHAPEVVFHLAAESHVDRSIDDPSAFVRTNVVGTFELLQAARVHWAGLPGLERERFRFVHVSTDEVYGSLGPEGMSSEGSPYAPSSPYAASKASADHLVRAFSRTYGLPAITTIASNNFGPHQFPEKLIPLVTLNAIEGGPMPLYGDGLHRRDWLFVGDHASALRAVAEHGEPGACYNVGANNERTTRQIVESVCDVLDVLHPPKHNPRVASLGLPSYRSLIRHVDDRPGHDRRYAIDSSKIRAQLGWHPETSFDDGLRTTIAWYLDHPSWCARIERETYQRQRLGLARP
jgi:dTDP-glucose 4,6-dehydratase